MLGSCLGSQLLADAAGSSRGGPGSPRSAGTRWRSRPTGVDDPLLGPLAPAFTAFEWHSYEVELPPRAVALAHSPVCLQAFRVGDLAWGIQFHAEVSEADARSWIDDYDSDPDAVAMGVVPDELHAQTDPISTPGTTWAARSAAASSTS